MAQQNWRKVALIRNPFLFFVSTKHRHPAYPSVMLFSSGDSRYSCVHSKDDLENARTSFFHTNGKWAKNITKMYDSLRIQQGFKLQLQVTDRCTPTITVAATFYIFWDKVTVNNRILATTLGETSNSCFRRLPSNHLFRRYK